VAYAMLLLLLLPLERRAVWLLRIYSKSIYVPIESKDSLQHFPFLLDYHDKHLHGKRLLRRQLFVLCIYIGNLLSSASAAVRTFFFCSISRRIRKLFLAFYAKCLTQKNEYFTHFRGLCDRLNLLFPAPLFSQLRNKKFIYFIHFFVIRS